MAKPLDYETRIQQIDKTLRVNESFDLIKRPLTIAGKRAVMYMIDGFVKDEIFEKIMEFLMKADAKDVNPLSTAREFADAFVSYVEVDIVPDMDAMITPVLSGTIALVMEQYQDIILIDGRTYPTRGVGEPEDDKVLRGSHDGFVETMVFNTALVRRRIRDTDLTMEIHQIGQTSKTDVVLSYMKSRVDKKFLKEVQHMLDNLNVNSLTMAQESLTEALLKKGWYNPFPKVRYTERPDTAAANLLEGKLVIIVDNTPTAIILPATVFDFVQESNDFYFPPMVGTYLRLVRMLIFLATIFLTPVWYLLVKNPEFIPPWLSFIQVAEPAGIPIWGQLLLFEIAIDGLKLASLNTPNALSNSFSVVGALILGDFAVQANWFVPEALMYMGFVAIGNFTQPSFELGYAFKLCRMLLIILIALFNFWGFIAGILVIILLVSTNRTVAGKSYLYPLIPFNWHDFSHLVVRRKMSNKNS